MKKITVKRESITDLLARTSSETAKAAFRRGNAAGAHEKDKTKQARMKTRVEEKRVEKGEYDE